MQGVIMKMHVPLDGPPDEPTILHNLTHHSPRGIALDACNRCAIYVLRRTLSCPIHGYTRAISSSLVPFRNFASSKRERERERERAKRNVLPKRDLIKKKITGDVG